MFFSKKWVVSPRCKKFHIDTLIFYFILFLFEFCSESMRWKISGRYTHFYIIFYFIYFLFEFFLFVRGTCFIPCNLSPPLCISGSDIVNIVRKVKNFFVQRRRVFKEKSDFSKEKSNHIYKRFLLFVMSCLT